MDKTIIILGGELAPEGLAILVASRCDGCHDGALSSTVPSRHRHHEGHKPDAVIVRLLADTLGARK
jgi:D-3-phosphoglycerate dehydrogenase